MSSVKTPLLVVARPSPRSTPKTVCSTTPAREFTVAVTRSIASQARSRLLIRTFDISQLPSPRNRAMAGWSDGYRADLVRRRLTPELISSLPGTAGLPPFISFSTSYPELESFVAKRMKATTHELESSHVPMLSKPNEVLDVIRAAANA